MSFSEVALLLAFIFFTIKMLMKWFALIGQAWPPERHRGVRLALTVLSAAALLIIIATIASLAAYDVVGIYVLFYILFGVTWIHFGTRWMARFFDLSWEDDVMGQNNRAALAAFGGGFLGLTLIYCGANIGDGPGWWCVLFAGGLGLAAWFVLGVLLHKLTGIFERITVDRDMGCAIRTGSWLLACGLILARASSGDWTSFEMTFIEFLDGWPVLILTLLAFVVERAYTGKMQNRRNAEPSRAFSSVYWGLVYLMLAAVSVVLLPPIPGK